MYALCLHSLSTCTSEMRSTDQLWKWDHNVTGHRPWERRRRPDLLPDLSSPIPERSSSWSSPLSPKLGVRSLSLYSKASKATMKFSGYGGRPFKAFMIISFHWQALLCTAVHIQAALHDSYTLTCFLHFSYFLCRVSCEEKLYTLKMEKIACQGMMFKNVFDCIYHRFCTLRIPLML